MSSRVMYRESTSLFVLCDSQPCNLRQRTVLASYPGRSYTNLLSRKLIANLLSIVESDFSLLEATCPSRLLEGFAPQFGMESSLGPEVIVCRGIFQTPQ